MKRWTILRFLKPQLGREESTLLSNIDKTRIIVDMYKLDPEFFMTWIYPKIAAWDFPSFLSIKEELFELLRKEGAAI